ncbi:MAG: OmpA family protein, partial [Myxococcales bacterium]|nr:OmpA family protein [Myxococcales bacterium]
PTPPSAELTDLLDQVVTRRVEARLFSPVLFRFDSTELIACGEASLYQALDIIQQKGETVVIEGHADSVGDDDYNRALSRKRADFVYRWLVRHGVPPRRLRVAARGEQQPLVPEPENAGDSDNDIDPAVAPQGRLQLNRRVTFRIAREEGPIPEDEGSVDAVPLEVAGPAEATP